ncbi:MAG: hypothetical protein QOG17_2617 [Gammaproteobacteria bacterium]|nr:hypothetical protein [Gammaproteobacteria bacterium]
MPGGIRYRIRSSDPDAIESESARFARERRFQVGRGEF